MFSFKRFLSMILPMSVVISGVAYSEQMDPGQHARPGDVNRDGVHDIRDVQGIISQAMHQSEQTPEGNMDGDDVVDIFDVQQCVNTALGTAGLVQRVGGRIQFDHAIFGGGMHVRAISEDGQSANAEADSVTGEFSMMLGAGTGWSLVCMGELDDEQGYQVGVMEFPVGDSNSLLLPFPELSEGDEPYLGDFHFGPRMVIPDDIRRMHGWLNNGIVEQDADGDGIPDYMAPLMDRAHHGPGVFGDMSGSVLNGMVAQCIEEWLAEVTAPSLVDANEDGIPDFVEPLIVCLESNMEGWFGHFGHQGGMMDGAKMMGGGHGGGPNETPPYVADIIAYVLEWVPEWVASLDQPDLIDEDGDGIPDFLADFLETPGGPGRLDINGDGIPDFAQDDDGDGIPNCLDEDAWTDEDCDGDGVPNRLDRDDDNDGIHDYADAEPCNSNVA